MVPLSARARDYFRGKVVVVTGAASGIGEALTAALAAIGAEVVAADIDREKLERSVARLDDRGRVTAIALDVRSRDAWDAFVARVDREQRRIDVLFNNAGVAVGGDTLELTREHWQSVIDVNLWGVIHGTLACAPHMLRRGDGHIVNMASMFGLFPAPFETAYATTKHAVVGFTTSLGAELRERGVQLTAVCPGYVDTSIWHTSPVVGIDREAALRVVPFAAMPVERAVREILEGVAKRPPFVVFPRETRATWWIHRLSPRLLLHFIRKHVRDFRAAQRLPSATRATPSRPSPETLNPG